MNESMLLNLRPLPSSHSLSDARVALVRSSYLKSVLFSSTIRSPPVGETCRYNVYFVIGLTLRNSGPDAKFRKPKSLGDPCDVPLTF